MMLLRKLLQLSEQHEDSLTESWDLIQWGNEYLSHFISSGYKLSLSIATAFLFVEGIKSVFRDIKKNKDLSSNELATLDKSLSPFVRDKKKRAAMVKEFHNDPVKFEKFWRYLIVTVRKGLRAEFIKKEKTLPLEKRNEVVELLNKLDADSELDTAAVERLYRLLNIQADVT